MKKRIVFLGVVVLALVFAAVGVIAVYASGNRADVPAQTGDAAAKAAGEASLPRDEEAACKASEKLSRKWFGTNGLEYPDYYGGQQIENGRLTVYLTDMEKAEEVRGILGSNCEYTDLVPVRYSLNELNAMASEYHAKLSAAGVRVIMAGVREPENRVIIGVSANDVQRAADFIKECGDLPIAVFESGEWTNL